MRLPEVGSQVKAKLDLIIPADPPHFPNDFIDVPVGSIGTVKEVSGEVGPNGHCWLHVCWKVPSRRGGEVIHNVNNISQVELV
jgi:hypothetical protein